MKGTKTARLHRKQQDSDLRLIYQLKNNTIRVISQLRYASYRIVIRIILLTSSNHVFIVITLSENFTNPVRLLQRNARTLRKTYTNDSTELPNYTVVWLFLDMRSRCRETPQRVIHGRGK